MLNKLNNEIANLNLEEAGVAELYQTYINNLKLVYPDRHFACFKTSFKKTYFYQRLACIQQYNSEYDDNGVVDIISTAPSVILTAHIYSYRVVVKYLSQKGLKIALMVSAEVYSEQRGIFEDIMRRLHGEQFAERFLLLDAEKPTVLLQARRLFDRGFHILGYIDGNTGAKIADKTSSNNLMHVGFGAADLHVRKGIVQLAKWLSCPLHFVWADKNINGQTFFNIRSLDTQRDIDQLVTQLYSDLYHIIEDEPEKWECFLYLQDFI